MSSINIDSQLKKHDLYIFLVRTNSLFSRIISLFTHCNYTHASVGLDAACCDLYSFARLHTNSPIPAGFVKESTDRGLLSLSPNAPCAVYRVGITEQAYEDVCAKLRYMYVNKEKFKYNYFGPVCCFLGLPIRIKNKYFCSQFVAEILSENNIVKLKKSAALYHPRDLAKLEELTLVYEGKLSELNAENNDLAQTIVIGAEA